jgi:hypothetical protein
LAGSGELSGVHVHAGDLLAVLEGTGKHGRDVSAGRLGQGRKHPRPGLRRSPVPGTLSAEGIVPFDVQQRAWECAYSILGDSPGRLTPCTRIHCEQALRMGPDALSWRDAQDMQELAQRIFGERV